MMMDTVINRPPTLEETQEIARLAAALRLRGYTVHCGYLGGPEEQLSSIVRVYTVQQPHDTLLPEAVAYMSSVPGLVWLYRRDAPSRHDDFDLIAVPRDKHILEVLL